MREKAIELAVPFVSFLLWTIIIDNFLFDYGQEGAKEVEKSKSRSGGRDICGDFNSWSGRILETGKSRAMMSEEGETDAVLL